MFHLFLFYFVQLQFGSESGGSSLLAAVELRSRLVSDKYVDFVAFFARSSYFFGPALLIQRAQSKSAKKCLFVTSIHFKCILQKIII